MLQGLQGSDSLSGIQFQTTQTQIGQLLVFQFLPKFVPVLVFQRRNYDLLLIVFFFQDHQLVQKYAVISYVFEAGQVGGAVQNEGLDEVFARTFIIEEHTEGLQLIYHAADTPNVDCVPVVSS